MDHLEKIGEGLNAVVYDNQDGTVLKVCKPDVPPHLYRQDYEISSKVAEHYENTAKVIGLKEMAPTPGIIFEKIDGPNLVQNIQENPVCVYRFARSFAETHFQIHQLRIDDIPKQKDTLLEQIQAVDAHQIDKDFIIRHLESLPDGMNLCHNDYMPTNMIYSRRGIVVVDWRTATAGNPASDVARTLLLMNVPKRDIGISLFDDIVRKAFTRQYLSHYGRIAAVSRKEIFDWLLPLSFIRLGENPSDRERKAIIRFLNSEINKLRA